MRLSLLPAAAAILLLTGCHSAYIEATLRNATPHPISLVELDYPSASFGTQTLAPGETFHYRFKLLGSGPLKLLYTDPATPETTVSPAHPEQDHTFTGPSLNEGDEGTLLVTITPTTPQWTTNLHHR
jgi:hypothetical protein